MAYLPEGDNAEFITATDLAPVIFDGIGKVAVAVISLATIIGLILVYRYIKSGKFG